MGPLRRLKPVYEGAFREDPWAVEKLVLRTKLVMAIEWGAPLEGGGAWRGRVWGLF